MESHGRTRATQNEDVNSVIVRCFWVSTVFALGLCAQNPEPLAPFIDLFVSGDGEPALPLVCDEWLRLKEECRGAGGFASGEAGQRQREEMLGEP